MISFFLGFIIGMTLLCVLPPVYSKARAMLERKEEDPIKDEAELLWEALIDKIVSYPITEWAKPISIDRRHAKFLVANYEITYSDYSFAEYTIRGNQASISGYSKRLAERIEEVYNYCRTRDRAINLRKVLGDK